MRPRLASLLSSLLALAGAAPSLAGEEGAAAAPQLCAAYSGLPEGEGAKAGMAFIPGGTFVLGSDPQQPEERFTHIVRVDPFWIDRHEVTNAQFSRFVAATHYVTLAERGLDPKTHPGASEELLAPGSALFVQPMKADRSGSNAQWRQLARARGPGLDHRRPREPSRRARRL